MVTHRSSFAHHPTDSSRFRFFSRKLSRAIYDSNSKTFLTFAIRQEIDFVITVLSDPSTYWWGSPIAHLIKREHDGETFQDACPRGAGGFSYDFQFWWTVQWPDLVYQRTTISPKDPSYISNNLLEYAALLFGLAGAILAWEALPVNTRPSHPLVLLWTDNTTARAWTKKISGIKSPQGRSLARILAHLLMFSEMGIESQHIEGIENVVADFLSRLFETHHFSAFTYQHLQERFPWLTLSHRFLPSNELRALVFTALSMPSVNIPTARVSLGHLEAAPSTSKQTFFGIPK